MSPKSPPRSLNDEKSTADNTPSPKSQMKTQRYRPKQKELCQAILCIKQQLPMRSLEQTIIRLHHTLNQKRKELTGEDMDDQDKQGQEEGDNYICLENQEDASFLLHQEANDMRGAEEIGQYQIDPYVSLPTAPAIYQYKPSREQVTETYPKLYVRKQASNQQKMKIQQRITIAKLFMQDGLNYQSYLNMMQENESKKKLNQAEYNHNIASIFLQTIKKLEHFIIQSCGKFIKPFNNTQIRKLFLYIKTSILTIPPQIQFTFFSFIKSTLGLTQIQIQQTPGINLYLFLIKKIAKRNISFSSLEQIGQQQFMAKMKATVESLGNIKLEKEEIYERRKHQRMERKERKSLVGDKHSEEDSKRSGEEVHLSLDWWDDQIDEEFTRIYFKCKDPVTAFRTIQSKHRQLKNWTPFHFNKKFSKLVRKAIQKTQIQSQNNQSQTQVVNRLSKEEMNRVVSSLEGEFVRKCLLQFYINPEPPIRLLSMAVQQTNRFLYPDLIERKGRGRPKGSRNLAKGERISSQITEETEHFRRPLEYNQQISINQQSHMFEGNQNECNFFYEESEAPPERKGRSNKEERNEEFYFEEDDSEEFYEKLQIRSQENQFDNNDH